MIRALALLLALCALCVLGDAHAAASDEPITYQSCSASTSTCDIEQAWRAAAAYCVKNPGAGTPTNGCYYRRKEGFKQIGVYSDNQYKFATLTKYFATDCAAGKVFDNATGICKDKCNASDPPLGRTTLLVPPGTTENPWLNQPYSTCKDECAYNGALDDSAHFIIDGQQYVTYSTMTATGQTCTAGGGDYGTEGTPPADSDGDGTSDGKDGDPGNPGSDGTDGPGDTDGDGVNDCGGEGQPRCPDKTDGTDHKSSGGGDCNTPPVSSGDPILAQIAFQTWATRCAIQGKANTGGTGGGSVPGNGDGTAAGGGEDCAQAWTCNGDPVGCATLLEQHTQRCAAEGLRKGIEDYEGDDTYLNGTAEDAFGVGPGMDANMLDSAGWLGSRDCPVGEVEGLEGLDLVSAVCPGASILGAYILILGFMHGMHILGKAAAGG